MNPKNKKYVLIFIILFIYLFYGNYPKHFDFWVMNYVAKSFAMGNIDFYSDILEIQKLPPNFMPYFGILPNIWQCPNLEYLMRN